MAIFARDPLHNAIHDGIKEVINVAMEHERFRAAIILIYSGMDAMAYLNMPADHSMVTKSEFIRWAERYIRFPCKEQLTGADLYGARCAMLHSYGVVSSMSQENKCRIVGYSDHMEPEIIWNNNLDNLVLVSVRALKNAFFKGIDEFLVNAFANREQAPVLEKRLQWFINVMPFNVSEQGEAKPETASP